MRFVCTHVRHALQHAVAIGAFSPYFAAACETRIVANCFTGPHGTPYSATPSADQNARLSPTTHALSIRSAAIRKNAAPT
jgi:hypothetical protein